MTVDLMTLIAVFTVPALLVGWYSYVALGAARDMRDIAEYSDRFQRRMNEKAIEINREIEDLTR